MATTYNRTLINSYVDDDGTTQTGTPIDKADMVDIPDQVDALIANPIVFGSTITERNRAAAIGVRTDVAFNAGNFSGSGSMTWTVGAPDHVAFWFIQIGTSVWVFVDVRNTDVGGTPSSALQIAIPGGVTPLLDNQSEQAIRVKNNGTYEWGFALVRSTGAGIQIFADKTATTNWSASAGATDVHGLIGPFQAA